MNPPNSAAAPIAPMPMPGTPTTPGYAPMPVAPAPSYDAPAPGSLFDNATSYGPASPAHPGEEVIDELRRAALRPHEFPPGTATTLERATSIGSMPSSHVARTVIRTKGAEYGLPQDYVDTALRAQDLAEAIEKDMDDTSRLLLQQMSSSGGGDPAELLEMLRALDQRSNQLIRLQQHLRDNFLLARTNPVLAKSQLQEWLGELPGR